MPIASRSPGRQPGRDRGGDRGLLGADAERIGGVLDVHALELAAVARPHDRADEVARVRRVRPRGGLASALWTSRRLIARSWKSARVVRAAEQRAEQHLERRVHARLDARLGDEQRQHERDRRDEEAVVRRRRRR